MRKLLYILVLCFISLQLLSQDNSDFDLKSFENKYFQREYSQTLKLNPWNYLIGVIPISMEIGGSTEFMIKNKQSIEIGAAYITKNIFVLIYEDSLRANGSNERFRINGGRFQLTHKIYIKNSSNIDPIGFYFGPHISYTATKISSTYSRPYNNYLVISHFNVNLNIGYQFNPTNNIIIDTFIGIGYKKNIWKEYNPIGSLTSNVSTISTSDLGVYYNSPIRYSLGIRFGIGIK